MGAYDDLTGANHSEKVDDVITDVSSTTIPANTTDIAAVRNGINLAKQQNYTWMNNTLIRNSTKLSLAVREASIAAADAIQSGWNVINDSYDAVFGILKGYLDKSPGFKTDGLYHETNIIDTGNDGARDGYIQKIAGNVMIGSSWVKAPGIDRTRTSNPNLGSEVLWNSGPNPIAAPELSPAVFVVARNKYIWRAPIGQVPIAISQQNNSDSIGLIVRFNLFFYYTGGDLPANGENLIADAVMNNGLPDPQHPGNFFPIPHRIACFKCGHHGAKESTSNHFLTTTDARGAFISCGQKSFGKTSVIHPTQAVIDRLVAGDNRIRYFYLTNCREIRTHIPASQDPPANQLPLMENKSRLAGDNAEDNLAVSRHRGDIQIVINQAESNSTVTTMPLNGNQVLRQYHVVYYECDSGVTNFRMENTVF
jgi:hypothetical protein